MGSSYKTSKKSTIRMSNIEDLFWNIDSDILVASRTWLENMFHRSVSRVKICKVTNKCIWILAGRGIYKVGPFFVLNLKMYLPLWIYIYIISSKLASATLEQYLFNFYSKLTKMKSELRQYQSVCIVTLKLFLLMRKRIQNPVNG